MAKSKKGFWQRMFGNKKEPDLPSTKPPIEIPKITMSRDHSWSVSESAGSDVDEVYLRQQMMNFLSFEQLYALAERFDIEVDALSGGKGRQVMDVITAVSQTHSLADLLTYCQDTFPNVTWQK